MKEYRVVSSLITDSPAIWPQLEGAINDFAKQGFVVKQMTGFQYRDKQAIYVIMEREA